MSPDTELGKIDFSYMKEKALAVLTAPMKAQTTFADIMRTNPGLLTGVALTAILAFVSGIGGVIIALILVRGLVGPFGIGGLVGAVIGALIVAPIIAVVVWAVLSLISLLIGKAVKGEPIELKVREFGSLAVMFAFASVPTVLNIIPWGFIPVLGWLVSLGIGAWVYYYTWLSARVYFEVDAMKAALITIIQLLLFLLSIFGVGLWGWI